MLASVTLLGCGSSPLSTQPSLRVFAASATETAVPTAATATPLPSATAVATLAPTITPGPVAYVVDFTSERKELTLHVGDRILLQLTQGPRSDWMSGVDDARVLQPVGPQETGVYQAVALGTTLVTAHVPFGCANTLPARPCNPETGLWMQMRVYVVP